MSTRFFAAAPVDGDCAQLTGAERQHLVKVMRAREGDTVTLFDGSGAEFTARITRIDRRAVDLAVLARHDVDRESPLRLTLGLALPKGERQRWLVEKAVELGVSCVTPLVTARGVAQPTEQTLSRLRRHVVEASKQCGRNRLMEITPPHTLANFCARISKTSLCLLAHPSASAKPLSAFPTPRPDTPVYVAVGPEGGFADEDLAAADGWQRVHLGPRTLRTETAALALAAYLLLLGSAPEGARGN